MEQLFILKIIDIQEALNDKCILKASDFEKFCKEANIYKNTSDAKWNKYVHKNCSKYNFEVWKFKLGQNFYVKATDDCRQEASKQKLIPHSNSDLLRGEPRKNKNNKAD